ncbi:MAG: (2Fe-2S)-binding protein [Burkholderiaceae bacterium]|nr:(2Fe-2S)-binding protein [Burkholderiaceae bacterium]
MTLPLESRLTLTVNGHTHVGLVEARTTLVDFLRDQLGLTGTHVGCEHGVCGACSVLLDGLPVRACCMFALQADGMEVTTVEGLASASATGARLQEAFCESHALQCGYCTPGMLIACEALLRSTPEPSESQVREAIGGNLCRCTGYQQIVDAVLSLTADAASDRIHDESQNGRE